MHAGSTPSSVRERNPVELLQTAERLFAIHGIDGVSLRQIGSEAGHRNPAAVQYHFGSKAELLAAILEHRLPGINARRLELLERLRSQGDDDLRNLVEAMARPLLELDPETNHYVPFLARLMAHRSELRTAYAATLDLALSAKLTAEGINAALTDLPEPVRWHRFSMASELMVHVIANRQARSAAGEDDGLSREQFENDLFDAMVGLLRATHTPAAGDPR